VNNTASTLARLTKPISGIPPLLEVGILRACQQTHKEGSHILYTQNTFAVILRQGYYWKVRIPYSLNHSRIRNFRTEVQLEGPCFRDGMHVLRTYSFYQLSEMHDLKLLQVLVTFRGHTSFHKESEVQAAQHAVLFNRCWRITTAYNNTMCALIAKIPKDIELSLGLTKAQKEVGDYGGFAYAKGCVLRKIYSTYEHIRGTDVGSENLDWRKVGHLPIDGDGQDSDEEK
jgi:hypothetical protein